VPVGFPKHSQTCVEQPPPRRVPVVSRLAARAAIRALPDLCFGLVSGRLEAHSSRLSPLGYATRSPGTPGAFFYSAENFLGLVHLGGALMPVVSAQKKSPGLLKDGV
jgi:hypothetical protein